MVAVELGLVFVVGERIFYREPLVFFSHVYSCANRLSLSKPTRLLEYTSLRYPYVLTQPKKVQSRPKKPVLMRPERRHAPSWSAARSRAWPKGDFSRASSFNRVGEGILPRAFRVYRTVLIIVRIDSPSRSPNVSSRKTSLRHSCLDAAKQRVPSLHQSPV